MAGNETISTKQYRAIACLLTEKDIASAAIAAQVGETTLHRWLAEPVFRDALSRAENDLVVQASGRLAAMLGKTLDVLENELNAPNAKARLKAADLILHHYMRIRGQVALLDKEAKSEIDKNSIEGELVD